jgi:imidazolonepropionase-like amidohydrolase
MLAVALIAATALLGGCATDGLSGVGAKPQATAAAKPPEKSQEKPRPLPPGLDASANPDVFPSTYKPFPSRPTAIVGAHIFNGAGGEIPDGVVLMRDGKIEQVGAGLAVPAGYAVVDGHGKWVTPGLIDTHSHLGVYASPSNQASSDGNEATSPVTAEVWAEHSIWPQDPGFNRAREGGVTTLLILPGSANLIGGRSSTVRNVPARTYQGMKMPGAPYGLKMACGENPKRVYGSKGRSPSTRMGNVAGYRSAWIGAAEYERKWDDYHAKIKKGDKADPPGRSLQNDTLAGVLRGEILVENHCYRADEMATMIDISKEFGYHVTAFHHAVEAYKIADLLRENDICVATWANWWGFKMEAYDSVEDNVPLLHKAGVCAIIKSDDADLTQRLNQEAAEALSAGRRDGIDIPEREAIEWITKNPAKALGILDQTGTLEPGKRADVVIWDRDPFSIYALTQQVYIDGAIIYDRNDKRFQPSSDFEIGHPGEIR